MNDRVDEFHWSTPEEEDDAIMAEVRRNREALAARFGYDLRRMSEYAQWHQYTWGLPVVSFAAPPNPWLSRLVEQGDEKALRRAVRRIREHRFKQLGFNVRRLRRHPMWQPCGSDERLKR